MTIQPVQTPIARPPIIAVFGGNGVPDAVLARARRVASSIADLGCIVLTGGDGTGLRNVKDAAVDVVRRQSPWVGVLNGRRRDPSFEASDRGGLVKPMMGDQRNLLEAWMSDAAVVLEGGPGTASECVSMLCLGKPVLLIGRPTGLAGLVELFEGDPQDAEQKQALVQAAKATLDATTGPMAEHVEETITVEKLVTTARCRHLTGEAVDRGTEEWLASVSVAPRSGDFPDLAGLHDLRRDYLIWLRAAGS